MTQSIETIAIEPMMPKGRMAQTKILPGTAVIGFGVDVFGEYCSANSLKLPIIDTSDLTKPVDGSDLLTSTLVTVLPAHEGMAEQVQGSTLREVANSLAASVKLEGSSGFLSGEMSAAFNTSTSHKTSTRYVQYTEQIYSRQLRLGSFTSLRKHMLPDAKSDFEGTDMSPAELVEQYGTHFIQGLIIGARLSYGCSIDTSDYTSDVDMSVAAKLSYNALVNKGSGSASASQTQAAKVMTEKSMSKARVLGGDPEYVENILKGDYDKWRQSIADHMHVVDLYNGMCLISKLIEDPTRRAAVDAAITQKMEAEKGPGDPFLSHVQSYHANATGCWYFSISEAGHPAGFGPYEYAGASFFAYTEPKNNSVPIYRFKSESGGRYMLSPNAAVPKGWLAPEIAFYAYTKSGPDRVLVRSFQNTSKPDQYGWFYNTKAKVSGWTPNERNNFYAPKG